MQDRALPDPLQGGEVPDLGTELVGGKALTEALKVAVIKDDGPTGLHLWVQLPGCVLCRRVEVAVYSEQRDPVDLVEGEVIIDEVSL